MYTWGRTPLLRCMDMYPSTALCRIDGSQALTVVGVALPLDSVLVLGNLSCPSARSSCNGSVAVCGGLAVGAAGLGQRFAVTLRSNLSGTISGAATVCLIVIN